MTDSRAEQTSFEHGAAFTPQAGDLAQWAGVEAQYEQLFADVLADGVITAEERASLDRAADELGLEPKRLLQLEQAMLAAYEARHRVRIVEQYEEAPRSLLLPVERDSQVSRELLLKRIEQLEARVRELEAELRRAEAAVNVEVDLSDAPAVVEHATDDPDEIWRRLRRDPTRPEPFRALYRIYAARSDLDRQWCVAQALVVLGKANTDERRCYEQHRTGTLITPAQGLAPAAWEQLLLHPEQELLTGHIFGVIAPAVLLGRVTTLRREGKLHVPPEQGRQEPLHSTITAVRAVPWAAAILGLPVPPVYVERERDAGYEHIPALPPLTLIGRRVLSGPSQLEHAFLVGRHLAWYRREHYVRKLFSAVPDLQDLFLAALMIGNPALPIATDVKRRVAPLAAAIEPVLEPPQIDQLRGLLMRFVEEGGRTNLQRWSLATEKTACRAGLLLCGDLPTCMALLEAEEGALGEQQKELLAFAVSERYFELRNVLGIGHAQRAAAQS